MKQIFLDNKPTTFYITENGFVYRKDTGKWYTPYENGGYLGYILKWENKSYAKAVHRLLASAYIPNPDNLPIVHHIDGNPFNNLLTNLQWISIQDHNSISHNNSIKIDLQNNTNIVNKEKEEWKQYKDTTFYVSNLGRVQNRKTNNILKGTILKTGYQRVVLKINKQAIGKMTHRLVWEVWQGPIKNIINHKNGNKLDNRLENLEDITQNENILKSCYETKTNSSVKMVGEYDENNNLVTFYASASKAARDKNVHVSSITEAVRTGNRSCGSYWKYLQFED